jgi:hypothetical protein
MTRTASQSRLARWDRGISAPLTLNLRLSACPACRPRPAAGARSRDVAGSDAVTSGSDAGSWAARHKGKTSIASSSVPFVGPDSSFAWRSFRGSRQPTRTGSRSTSRGRASPPTTPSLNPSTGVCGMSASAHTGSCRWPTQRPRSRRGGGSTTRAVLTLPWGG